MADEVRRLHELLESGAITREGVTAAMVASAAISGLVVAMLFTARGNPTADGSADSQVTGRGDGAELATALRGGDQRGHVYIVEPTGPFEDDLNVTNKKFPPRSQTP